MTKFTIIGAGMAGLLAGAILREECSSIEERQKSLPNNHSALLRFRSSIVGDTLNIPFRKVQVVKSVESTGNPVRDAVLYSLKTNGSARLRSIAGAKGDMETRFIAPDDLIRRMQEKVTAPIHFGQNWKPGYPDKLVISTLPMPALMDLLGYEHKLKFDWVNGYTITATLKNVDLCATVYLPGPAYNAYRVSITGDQLIIEYAFPGMLSEEADVIMHPLMSRIDLLMSHVGNILNVFGLTEKNITDLPLVSRQRFAKILPVDDEARKRFMLWATEHHNIYSFGRFATWRPGLLLDDLVNDLRVIQKLAGGATSYDARK